MAARGFWSRLFGKGNPEEEPDAPKPTPPETTPDQAPPPTQPKAKEETETETEPAPPAEAQTPRPATDGETRVSGTTSKPSFTTDKVSDVYAQALFELSAENGSQAEVTQEVEQLAELLAGSQDLIELISSRALGRLDRAGVIERVFKGKVSDTLFKFLNVLNHNDRLAALPGITASYARLVAEQAGIVEVDAYVAARLDDAAAKQVADSIGTALGGKQIVLHQYVDESLIGGLKIRVGDQLIDGSVATRLTKMKRDLVAAGREKARQMVAEGAEGSSDQGA